MKKYDVARNPHDKKWYVIGNCADGYWLPISYGFKTKAEAIKGITIQYKRDEAQIRDLYNSTLTPREAYD
ncbi:unnamed protein product [marine sediment metagenome]|uniref:AP2/ERF domain-containing protein n=1 Tax=marine sediment metagenome TaxID=412755 RepID=X1JQ15_9ZZZZ